ncbi:HNH endonuclease family protein [Shewanella insulae]|uniref:HNH endonuclease family protein n=1 Tax=Shewanella insulae TaxID=2681496 RepID=UPI002480FCF4|nr:DUF262 domain-containing protein [Shewanella insulae]
MLEPKSPGFNSVKNLMNRINANREDDLKKVVSVDDSDVPSWQRQVVWNEEEMGLLIYSIVKGYPIGTIILWQKENGIRVPIDGRQRLTAIKNFYNGHFSIPDLHKVDEKYRNKKYSLQAGDQEKGFTELSADEKDALDDYELSCKQYEDINEDIAMDIFVMLQGGKSLTKTEVRSALGGKLCDFVTSLTSDSHSLDDFDEEEEVSKHLFFQKISKNISNKRKAHRNLCDILLHEYLYPNKDKHWTSLETMYRDKVQTLTENEMDDFRKSLNKFMKDFTIDISGEKVLMPQLKSAFFILSVFKVWRELNNNYDLGSNFSFSDGLSEFETERVSNKDEYPWINFTSALSNAGYSQNRTQIRNDILFSFYLRKFDSIKPKKRDSKRTFTMEEKIAIWERAGRQCEHEDSNGRCKETFPHPREADADHIVKWKDNGETVISNGRLLCVHHNRSRK